jgi:hypothetical protein
MEQKTHLRISTSGATVSLGTIEGAILLARSLESNALRNLTRLSLSQECGTIGDDGFMALMFGYKSQSCVNVISKAAFRRNAWTTSSLLALFGYT